MADTVLRTAHPFVAVENSLTDDLIGGDARNVGVALLSPVVLHVVTSVRRVLESLEVVQIFPLSNRRTANAHRQEHKDPIWEVQNHEIRGDDE
jgi:hypothetical protein